MIDYPDLPKENNEKPYYYYCNVLTQYPILAALIKIPKKDATKEKLTYFELPCPDEDKNKIYDLIYTMGTTGKINLLLHHKSRLEKIGDEVRYIYPLRFLEVIFTTPELKKCMIEVLDDYFKRTNFVDGFGERMETEMIKGTVDLYLEDFARAVNADHSILKTYVNKKDWRGFLQYLTDL